MNSELPKEYLKFINLFNRGKYFEAHEVLEDFWREDKSEARDFYQGMIQVAAVFVHISRNNHTGARKLLLKAGKHLSKYPSPFRCTGIEGILECTEEAIVSQKTGVQIKLTE